MSKELTSLRTFPQPLVNNSTTAHFDFRVL
jgi:hypothetical protein